MCQCAKVSLSEMSNQSTKLTIPVVLSLSKQEIIKDLQQGINRSLIFNLIKQKEQWKTPSWFGKAFLNHIGIVIKNTYLDNGMKRVKQRIINVDVNRLKKYLSY
jgi:hypothetical protein